jgi:hypothetical protein
MQSFVVDITTLLQQSSQHSRDADVRANSLPLAWYAQFHALLAGARSSVYCATSQHITEEKSPSQCYINFTCKPMRPKARFVDPASGKWLWQWSAETTGLPAEVDLPEQTKGLA